MKKLLSAAAMAALASAASQASAQVLYDPFNYPAGQLDSTAAGANKNYSTSGTYWSTRGTGGSTAGMVNVAATGVGAPSNPSVPLLPSPMGLSAAYGSATGRTPALGFGQTFTSENTDVYYSLMLQAPGTLSTNSATMAGFTNFSIPTPNTLGVFQAGLRFVGASTSTFKLGMQSGGVTQEAAPTFNAGETIFVVARYRINTAARNDDTVALWLNPTSGFGDNSAIPLPDLSFAHTGATPDSVDAVTNLPMLAGFFMRPASGTTGLLLDELRVDTTWAGVTPNGHLQYGWTDAGAGANTFANPDKWTKSGSAPAAAPNGVGHVANFGSGIAAGSTVTSAGETFDQINLDTAGVTIEGTGLTVGSSASAGQIYAYSGNHTISAPLTMNSNLSVKTQTGTSVTIGGTVNGTSTLGIYGTGTVTLGAAERVDDLARLEVRSGTLDLGTFGETVATLQLGTSHPNNGAAISNGVLYNGDLASGTISNGTINAGSYDLQSGTISAAMGGSNGVVKNHSGRVTLSGNNTYTGNTVVNNGVLTLSGTNANPVTAVLNAPPNIIAGTSTLALTSNASLGGNGATVSISNAGISTSGTLQFAEDLTLASDRTITVEHANSRLAVVPGKTATVDALITGSGGVIVQFPFDPTVASSGGPNTGALATTAGVLVFRNTGNNYAGNTTVNAGRLQLGSALAAPGYNVAGRWVANSGATLGVSVGGTGEFTTEEIDNVRATATFNAGSFLGFDTTNATADVTYASSIASGNMNLVKHGAGTLKLTGDLAHSGTVVASGGTLVLGGNSTYAAQTLVDNGATLRVTSNNALGGTAGNTFIRGGGLTNANLNSTLELDGSAGDLTIAEPFLLEGKGGGPPGNPTPHINNVAGNNTLTGEITFDAAATWYNLRADGGSLTISGNITNSLTPNTTQRLLHLRGTASGTINGAIQNGGSSLAPTPVTKHDSGTWTLTGTNTYLGSTTVEAGTLNVTASAIPATTDVVVNGGSYNMTGGAGSVFKPGTLTVNGGQADVAASGSSTLAVKGLTISAGKLVTNDNDLIVDYTGASVESQVRQYVINGRVPLSTSGIFSTPGNPDDDVVLAVADNAAWGKTIFNNVNIDADTVVGKYTYFGDANLDGKVTGDDYLNVDANLGTGDSWLEGDFNMSGVTTGDDYLAIDANLGKGTANPLAFAELKEEMVALHVAMFGEEYLVKLAQVEAEGFGASVVPEPGAISLVGLGAIGLLGGRRRRA